MRIGGGGWEGDMYVIGESAACISNLYVCMQDKRKEVVADKYGYVCMYVGVCMCAWRG